MEFARPLALVALLSASAFADDKADKVEADKHYQLAKRHYNLNEWDEAIDEFKTAYKLFPDPVNLFNIAQAYRLKGKSCTTAAQFYANYQREEKNKKLRDSVTKVRKDMEDCAKTEKPDEPLPVPPPVPPRAGEEPMSPAPITPGIAPTGENAMRHVEPAPGNPDPNRNRRILGAVMLAGGAAFVIGGLLWSGQVSNLDDRLAKCTDLGCPGDEDEFDLEDQRNRASRNANASYGVGFTSIVVGGVIYLISRKPKPDQPRVTVMPMRGGAGVRVSF